MTIDLSQSSKKVPSVKNIKPVGSQLVVGILKPEEVLDTNLYISEDVQVTSAPQAYVLELGPDVNKKSYPVEVGSRILLQGTFVPVPTCKDLDTDRQVGVIEQHAIKGILVE